MKKASLSSGGNYNPKAAEDAAPNALSALSVEQRH